MDLVFETYELRQAREKIRTEFQPFFDKMVELMAINYQEKGESWKKCSIAYLLDRACVQFEDMQNDPAREDYMANLGNYAAMLWWHENLAQSIDNGGVGTK